MAYNFGNGEPGKAQGQSICVSKADSAIYPLTLFNCLLYVPRPPLTKMKRSIFFAITITLLSACARSATPMPIPTEVPPTPTVTPVRVAPLPIQAGSTYLYVDDTTLVAVLSGSFVMGASIGPLIGGPIVDRWGFHTLMWIDVLMMIVVVLSLSFGYFDSYRGKSRDSIWPMAGESIRVSFQAGHLRRHSRTCHVVCLSTGQRWILFWPSACQSIGKV